MKPSTTATQIAMPKRAANLKPDETPISKAWLCTPNPPTTMQTVLVPNLDQQQARAVRQRVANDCVAGWNALQAAVGSYADGHCTL